MSKEVEEALGQAGFAISDTPPTPDTQAEPQQEVQPEVEAAPVEAQPQAEPETVEQPVNEDTTPEEIDVDAEVLSFLSERLGRNFGSYDDISEALSYTPVEIDERVSAINKFVLETGRSPEDWYKYQSLDPSEMDDMSVMRLQMTADHPSLSPEEVNLLIGRKYKLDEDVHTEDEIRLSKLELKMDAEKAKRQISDLRDSYMAPDVSRDDVGSPIDEEWLNTMQRTTNEFGYLEFELPGTDETFKFGVDDDYRAQLVNRNSNIENYFDDYIAEDGSWDFFKLNAHRALIDNVDSIISSIYNQGLSDGKRGVVETAANVDASRPDVGTQPDSNTQLSEQLLKALGGGGGMTFNV